MKLIVLADIHGKLKPLERMQAAFAAVDAVLLAGDITDFGDADAARHVIAFIQQSAKRVLAVPGNCDPPAVTDYLAEAGVSIHGQAACIDGVWFVGAGGAISGSGTNVSIQQFADTLERAYAQCRHPQRLAVITHQPAYQTALDAVAPGRHTGNPAVRDFIDRVRPQLAVSGHIHERVGTDIIGATTFVNPGPAKQGRYAHVEWTDSAVAVKLHS